MTYTPPTIELITVPFTILSEDHIPFQYSASDTTFLITRVRKRSYRVSYYYNKYGRPTSSITHGTYTTLIKAVHALNYLYACNLLRLSRDQNIENKKEITALSKRLHKFDIILNRTK